MITWLCHDRFFSCLFSGRYVLHFESIIDMKWVWRVYIKNTNDRRDNLSHGIICNTRYTHLNSNNIVKIEYVKDCRHHKMRQYHLQ